MPNKVRVQTYFETIRKKTGKSPVDFRELGIAKGVFENGALKPTVKAGEVIAWLKKDFALGHGHSLALYHFIKGDLY
jgi:hypothetical protein